MKVPLQYMVAAIDWLVSASRSKRALRAQAIPWLLGVVVAGWLSTGLVVVGTNEYAAFFRLGRLQSDPLMPGVHFLLPRPMSQIAYIPVRQMRTVTIGFRAEPQEVAQAPLSWTSPHGRAEHPLIIGGGTELVSLNALVQFRVPDDKEAVRRYLSSTTRPETVLASIAQRVLTRETRDVTIDSLLSSDRGDWNRRITARLLADVENVQLGLEIVAFELVSVHPPVEVAKAYLDVVSARIDAERVVAETTAAAQTEMLRCEMIRHLDISDSKASSFDRWAEMTDEAAPMEALCDVDRWASDVLRWQLYCEELSTELQRRPVTLIDSRIPPETQLWFGAAK
ncbi:MAG: hypothetical protein JSS02_00090 [Planctomycetes bacterium]|nr:hypothetical protein [Planctomycetota bacterium]